MGSPNPVGTKVDMRVYNIFLTCANTQMLKFGYGSKWFVEASLLFVDENQPLKINLPKTLDNSTPYSTMALVLQRQPPSDY